MYFAIAFLAVGSICRAAEATKEIQTTQWTFEKEQTGKIPAGATVFAGNWAVRAESDAHNSPNALCQTGYAEYPALSLSDTVYDDVTVTAGLSLYRGKATGRPESFSVSGTRTITTFCGPTLWKIMSTSTSM
jgi:hypothetical protein